MSKYLPPAEKLPLAVRKSVRDNYEAKKPELEQKLSSLLGTEWKVDVNPAAIYPYAPEGSYGQNNLGGAIYEYVSGGLIWNLESFVKQQGPAGVQALNSAAKTHTVTIEADEKVTYVGADIKDGKLRLLFNPSYLATNISSAGSPSDLEAAINSASKESQGDSSLSYVARSGIEKYYTAKIDEVLQSAQKLLKLPKLSFEPSFEENAKALASSKEASSDWERDIGRFTFLYFEQFAQAIKDQKFDSDDLLQEAFQEEVSTGVIRLKIVDKLEKKTYNETVLKDGELVLQTVPKYWATNINDTSYELIKLF